MKWFNKLPPELRHLISSLLTALILGQAVKHGYVAPDQAAQIQINAAQEKQGAEN